MILRKVEKEVRDHVNCSVSLKYKEVPTHLEVVIFLFPNLDYNLMEKVKKGYQTSCLS